MSVHFPRFNRLLLWLVAGLFLAQFLVVIGYSINLPVGDEWEALAPGRLDWHLNWEWVLAPHNEHRIIPTKMLTWLLYRWTGLNFFDFIIINFACYSAAAYALASQCARLFKVPLWLMLIPFASCIAWENIAWSFQTSISLFLLFTALAIQSSLVPGRRSYWGLMWLAFASFTFGGGAPATIALVVTHGLQGILVRKRRAFAWLFAAGAAVVAGVWAATFHPGEASAGLSAVLSPTYRNNLIQFVGLGCGYQEQAWLAGSIALAVGLLCSGYLVVRLRRSRLGRQAEDAVAGFDAFTARSFQVLGLFLATLGPLAAIGLSRPGEHLELVSRYAQMAFAFGLLALGLCWSAVRMLIGTKHPKMRTAASALLAGAFTWPFAHHFDFDREYRLGYPGRVAGAKCIREYYQGIGAPMCLGLYPGSLKIQLDRARVLGVRFYRESQPEAR